MDFFTVPTLTFKVLYCFFIIRHDRLSIVHFNVTRHPTGSWIVQEMREAFPYQSAPEFLIFDHDAKYGLGSPSGDSIHEDRLRANLYLEPLAERNRGTLGGKLSPRLA